MWEWQIFIKIMWYCQDRCSEHKQLCIPEYILFGDNYIKQIWHYTIYNFTNIPQFKIWKVLFNCGDISLDMNSMY